MSKFHALRVQDVRTETPETVSIAFEVPAADAQSFRFIQGQYLTLKLTVNGEELRRSYSICSGVGEGELRIAVKRVPDGRASGFLTTKVSAGDSIEVMPPMGNFYSELNASQKKHYVLFAAGSGITPMMSIIKTVLDTEPQSTCSLFYGNKDAANTIFRGELDRLSSGSAGRLDVHYFFSQATPGDAFYGGRIDADKAREALNRHVADAQAAEHFLCGPEQMIFAIKDALTGMGVPAGQVHFELFTTPTESADAAPAAAAPAGDFNGNAKVTVIIDGDEVDFDLHTDGLPVLDAALDAGGDVPFACKGAVCCTCRAKVMEGSVSMEKNFALTDEEVEEGFVLTCQSHPTSERVVIDYDEV